MEKETGSRDRVTKRIRWIARIWSIPIIVIALLVFAGNVWGWVTTGVTDPNEVEGYPWTEALPPILMFLSIIGLAIAWRWERLGAIIALVFQLAVIVTLLIQTPLAQDFPRTAMPYVLWIIVTIPGVLFLLCWQRSR